MDYDYENMSTDELERIAAGKPVNAMTADEREDMVENAVSGGSTPERVRMPDVPYTPQNAGANGLGTIDPQYRNLRAEDFSQKPMTAAELTSIRRQGKTGIASEHDGTFWGGVKSVLQSMAHNSTGKLTETSTSKAQQTILRGYVENDDGTVTYLENLPDEDLDILMDEAGANGAMRYFGSFVPAISNIIKRGDDDLMRQFDRGEGRADKYTSDYARRCARAKYAQDIMRGVVSEKEGLKQAAEMELANRESSFGGELLAGLYEQGAYTGTYVAGSALAATLGLPTVAGAVLPGLVEGGTRFGERRLDEYGTDGDGNISVTSVRDDFGTALQKGAMRGAIAPTIEMVGGKAIKPLVKPLGWVAKATLGKIPLFKAVGNSAVVTTAGRAVDAWMKRMRLFGKLTGMQSMPEEALEEFEDQVIDAALGLDRNDDALEGTTAAGRALESAGDFMKPENLGDLAKSMLLMQVLQSGIAYQADRSAARNWTGDRNAPDGQRFVSETEDDKLGEFKDKDGNTRTVFKARNLDAMLMMAGVDANELRYYTAPEKAAAVNAWIGQMSEEEVAKTFKGAEKAVAELTAKMSEAGRAFDFGQKGVNEVDAAFTIGEFVPTEDGHGNQVERMDDAQSGVSIDMVRGTDGGVSYRVRDGFGNIRAAADKDKAIAYADSFARKNATRKAKVGYIEEQRRGGLLSGVDVIYGANIESVMDELDRRGVDRRGIDGSEGFDPSNPGFHVTLPNGNHAVCIVLDNNADVRTMNETIAHEAGTHYGFAELRKSGELGDFFKKLSKSGLSPTDRIRFDNAVGKIAQEYGLEPKLDAVLANPRAAEELWAYTTETMADRSPSVKERFVASLREWWRKRFDGDLQLNGDEIYVMANAMMRDMRGAEGGTATLATSNAESQDEATRRREALDADLESARRTKGGIVIRRNMEGQPLMLTFDSMADVTPNEGAPKQLTWNEVVQNGPSVLQSMQGGERSQNPQPLQTSANAPTSASTETPATTQPEAAKPVEARSDASDGVSDEESATPLDRTGLADILNEFLDGEDNAEKIKRIVEESTDTEAQYILDVLDGEMAGDETADTSRAIDEVLGQIDERKANEPVDEGTDNAKISKDRTALKAEITAQIVPAMTNLARRHNVSESKAAIVSALRKLNRRPGMPWSLKIDNITYSLEPDQFGNVPVWKLKNLISALKPNVNDKTVRKIAEVMQPVFDELYDEHAKAAEGERRRVDAIKKSRGKNSAKTRKANAANGQTEKQILVEMIKDAEDDRKYAIAQYAIAQGDADAIEKANKRLDFLQEALKTADNTKRVKDAEFDAIYAKYAEKEEAEGKTEDADDDYNPLDDIQPPQRTSEEQAAYEANPVAAWKDVLDDMDPEVAKGIISNYEANAKDDPEFARQQLERSIAANGPRTMWRRRGVSDRAIASLGPKFAEISQFFDESDGTPAVRWRRAQKSETYLGDMTDYMRGRRETKFADGDSRKSGAESIVYRDGNKVVKFRDADGMGEDVQRKIALHNELFPETPYTVLGIANDNESGGARIVMEQPYVDAKPYSGTEARRQIVERLKERFGAENVTTSDDIEEKKLLRPSAWFAVDVKTPNGTYHITDLKNLNVGVDADGVGKAWDAEIAFEPKETTNGDNGETRTMFRRRANAVTPAEDAAYMDAVMRGDMETAQRMVREAAAKAMPDTKVVNRSGEIKPVYHGTPNGAFTKFDKERIGETWNADDVGFFFTSSKSLADDYTRPFFKESSADPHLFNVYLNITNPLVIDRKWWQQNFGRSDIYKHDAIEIWDNCQREILDTLKDGSYDGVIVDPNPFGGEPQMYVAFGPEQIKSADPVTYDDAGNVIPLSQRFDQKNPDIRWRRRYTPDAELQRMADLRELSDSDRADLRDIIANGEAAYYENTKRKRDLLRRGTISPAEQMAVDATTQPGFGNKAKGWGRFLTSKEPWMWLREKVQDSLIAEREEERKRGVKANDSAYHAFDAAYGKIANDLKNFNEQTLDPFNRELAAKGFDEAKRKRLDMLTWALHAPEANRMIAERSDVLNKARKDENAKLIIEGVLNGTVALNDQTVESIADWAGLKPKEKAQLFWDLQGSGRSTAHANALLQHYRDTGFYDECTTPSVEGGRSLVDFAHEITKRTREALVASGRLSRKQADLWEQLSPNYMPFQSDFETESSAASRFFGLGGNKAEGNGAGNFDQYAHSEFQHAFGRRTIADSPIDAAIRQFHDAVARARDNEARRKMADMVRANPQMGYVFRFLSQSDRQQLAKEKAILENIVAKGTATPAQMAELNRVNATLAEANRADKAIPTTMVYGDNGIKHEVPVVSGLEGGKSNPTSIIAFKEDGDLKFIKLGGFTQEEVNDGALSDRDALRIATAVKYQNMVTNEGIRRLRTVTGLFSMARTSLVPTFILSNFLADTTQAALNLSATFGKNGAAKFMHYRWNSIKAARDFLSNVNRENPNDTLKYAEEWAANGGMIGGRTVETLREINGRIARDVRKLSRSGMKDIHSPKDLIRYLTDKGRDVMSFAEYWNSVIEMSTRIAAYATVRDMQKAKGETADNIAEHIAEAVSYARDVTVNFNRKGTLGNVINAWWAFGNANMQDIQRSLHALGEGDATGFTLGLGRAGFRVGKAGLKMWGALTALQFVASVLGHMLGDDPEDEKEGLPQFKDTPDYLKKSKLGILAGPNVRGINRSPMYFGASLFDVAFGHKGVLQAAKENLGLFASHFFDFAGDTGEEINKAIPSVLRPAFELQQNKNFMGQQIYREPFFGDKDNTTVRSELGKKQTSGLSKAVARALNWATGGSENKRGAIDVQPEKISALADWLFGGMTKDVREFSQTFADLASFNAPNMKNVPFLNRMVKQRYENSANYNKALERYDALVAEYEANVKDGNMDAAADMEREHPFLNERRSKRWNEELKQLKKIKTELQKREVKAETQEDYDAIHAMRMKTQYLFIHRLETPPQGDAEDAGLRQHNRIAERFVKKRRADERRAKKQEERESDRRKRGIFK